MEALNKCPLLRGEEAQKLAALWSSHPYPLASSAAATNFFRTGSLCEPAESYTDPHDPPP
jgi:hypothetical protein